MAVFGIIEVFLLFFLLGDAHVIAITAVLRWASSAASAEIVLSGELPTHSLSTYCPIAIGDTTTCTRTRRRYFVCVLEGILV